MLDKKKLSLEEKSKEIPLYEKINSIHQFYRDVNYYKDRGMSEKDSIRYVNFFYRCMREDKKNEPKKIFKED
jgi:hypothetical protein